MRKRVKNNQGVVYMLYDDQKNRRSWDSSVFLSEIFFWKILGTNSNFAKDLIFVSSFEPNLAGQGFNPIPRAVSRRC